MSIKWDIAERMRDAGYDMMTALEEADRFIKEFKASGEKRMTFGIMAGRKCVDTLVIERR